MLNAKIFLDSAQDLSKQLFFFTSATASSSSSSSSSSPTSSSTESLTVTKSSEDKLEAIWKLIGECLRQQVKKMMDLKKQKEKQEKRKKQQQHQRQEEKKKEEQQEDEEEHEEEQEDEEEEEEQEDQNNNQEEEEEEKFVFGLPDPVEISVSSLTLDELVKLAVCLLKLCHTHETTGENEQEKDEEFGCSSASSYTRWFALRSLASWVCEVAAESIRGRLHISKSSSSSSSSSSRKEETEQMKQQHGSLKKEEDNEDDEILLERELFHLLHDDHLFFRRDDAIEVLSSDVQKIHKLEKQQQNQTKGKFSLMETAESISKTKNWNSILVKAPSLKKKKRKVCEDDDEDEDQEEEDEDSDYDENEDDENENAGVQDWKEGLCVLAPFIIIINIDDNNNKRPQHHTLLLRRLERLQSVVEDRSIKKFLDYWICGLRAHMFYSFAASVLSCLVAAASSPIVEKQQKLETHLEKGLIRSAVIQAAQEKQQQIEEGGKNHKERTEEEEEEGKCHHHNNNNNNNDDDGSDDDDDHDVILVVPKPTTTTVMVLLDKKDSISKDFCLDKEKERQKRNNKTNSLSSSSSSFSIFSFLGIKPRDARWTRDGFRLLNSLLGAKLGNKLLVTMVDTLLKRVAAGHREDEKKKLTLAWTRVPLSTMQSLSVDRVSEVTHYPNQLEGVSVWLQSGLVQFGRSILRFGTALLAVSASASSQQQQQADSSNSSNNSNNKAAASVHAFVSSTSSWLDRKFVSPVLNSACSIFSTTSLVASSLFNCVRTSTSVTDFLHNFTSLSKKGLFVIWQSPTARVTLYLIFVTWFVSTVKYLFKEFKDSRRVSRFLQPVKDEEEISNGAQEYSSLRRRGKVLMTPQAIISQMTSVLRVQGHSDETLMRMWYEARNQSSSCSSSSSSSSSSPLTSSLKDEDEKKKQNNNKKKSNNKKRKLPLSPTAKLLITMSQDSLKSFFSTVSEISEWLLPIIAAGIFDRFLSSSTSTSSSPSSSAQEGNSQQQKLSETTTTTTTKIIISRFLLLECLSSAQGLVTSWKALRETWQDRVRLNAFKTLIIDRISNGVLEQQQQEEKGKQSSSFSSSKFRLRAENASDDETQAIVRYLINSNNNSNNNNENDNNSCEKVKIERNLSLCVVPRHQQQERRSKEKQEEEESFYRFAYPSQPNRVVLNLSLDSFSLPLTPGKIVVIDGESGSGKSTLIRLLLGEYEAYHTRRKNHNNNEKEQEEEEEEDLTLGLKLTEKFINEKEEEKKDEILCESNFESSVPFSSSSSSSTTTTPSLSSSSSSFSTCPLSNLAPRFLHSKLFSFVPQHCSLLPGRNSYNIAENISLLPCSQRNPDEKVLARVRQAAHIAGCDISSMPLGLWTNVYPSRSTTSDSSSGGGGAESESSSSSAGGDGEGSGSSSTSGGGGAGHSTGGGGGHSGSLGLSGGQIQRIVIARAVYRGASFILMDEPSSALDAKNTKDLMKHLRKCVSSYSPTSSASSSSPSSPLTPSSSCRNNNEDSLLPYPKCIICVTHDANIKKVADTTVTLKKYL